MNNYTVAVVGAPGVGKTSILSQLYRRQIYKYHNPTLAPKSEDIIYKLDRNCVCNYTLIDFPGINLDQPLPKALLTNVHAYVVIFSLTHFESFVIAEQIIDKIMKAYDYSTVIPIVMIGNKTDLPSPKKGSTTARYKRKYINNPAENITRKNMRIFDLDKYCDPKDYDRSNFNPDKHAQLRQVRIEEPNALARKYNLEYMESCSHIHIDVTKIFSNVLIRLREIAEEELVITQRRGQIHDDKMTDKEFIAYHSLPPSKKAPTWKQLGQVMMTEKRKVDAINLKFKLKLIKKEEAYKAIYSHAQKIFETHEKRLAMLTHPENANDSYLDEIGVKPFLTPENFNRYPTKQAHEPEITMGTTNQVTSSSNHEITKAASSENTEIAASSLKSENGEQNSSNNSDRIVSDSSSPVSDRKDKPKKKRFMSILRVIAWRNKKQGKTDPSEETTKTTQ